MSRETKLVEYFCTPASRNLFPETKDRFVLTFQETFGGSSECDHDCNLSNTLFYNPSSDLEDFFVLTVNGLKLKDTAPHRLPKLKYYMITSQGQKFWIDMKPRFLFWEQNSVQVFNFLQKHGSTLEKNLPELGLFLQAACLGELEPSKTRKFFDTPIKIPESYCQALNKLMPLAIRCGF